MNGLTEKHRRDKIMTLEETIKYVERLLEDQDIRDIEIRRTKRGFIVLQVNRIIMTGES